MIHLMPFGMAARIALLMIYDDSNHWSHGDPSRSMATYLKMTVHNLLEFNEDCGAHND